MDKARTHLKHHPSEVGWCQTHSEVGDIRLFQGNPAGRAGLALPEVLEGARLAEQVAALRSKARAVCVLLRGGVGAQEISFYWMSCAWYITMWR